jgi:hypothetical protein
MSQIYLPTFTYKYYDSVRQKVKGLRLLPVSRINEFAESRFSGYTACVLRYDCSIPAAAIRPQQPLCDTNPVRRRLLVSMARPGDTSPRCTQPEVGLLQS